MADNVAVTAGSGTSIATDDVSSVHFQKIKVDAGGDGVSVPIIAGQQTAAASVPVVLASDKTVTVVQGTATSLKVDASGVAVPVTDNGGNLSIDDGGNSITVDGSVTVTQATGTNLHAVIDSGTVTTVSTVTAVTTVAAVTAITNVVHVDDNSGSLTVDYATTGSGTSTGALRVELPTNGTGVVGLNAGTATIGAAFGFATTVSASATKSSTTTTYTVGDCWSDSTSAPTSGGFTFSNAARISGGSGVITDVFITNSVGPALMLQGELWIYDTAITHDNDNVAFTNVDAEVLTAVVVVPFTLAASAVGSVNSYAHIQNLNAGFTCVGSANLRFKVKVQNAYVNTASEVLNFRLKIMQTN